MLTVKCLFFSEVIGTALAIHYYVTAEYSRVSWTINNPCDDPISIKTFFVFTSVRRDWSNPAQSEEYNTSINRGGGCNLSSLSVSE